MVEAQTPQETGGGSPRQGMDRETGNDVRVFAKGGAIQMVGLAMQRGLQFLFAAIAVRILGTAGYGIYRQVAQVLNIGATLGLGGFHVAVVRFIARARATGDHAGVRGAARTAILGTGLLSFFIAGVIFVGAGPIARAFVPAAQERAQFASLFRLGAIYVPLFAAMRVLQGCTQAYKTMVPSVVIGNIVQPGVRFLAGALALVAGLQVTGAVWTLSLSMGAAALVGAWMYLRILEPQEKAATPHLNFREMLKFSFPQGASQLLSIQSSGMGIIFLGILSENRQVGLFAVALALQAPGQVVHVAVQNIWAPLVADLYERGEIDRLRSLFQTITRWVATCSLPIFGILMVEPDVFVRLFGGADAADAAAVTAVVAAGNVFFTGTGPTGYAIAMIGRPFVNLTNSVTAVALYFGLGLLLVPTYDALGMAIVYAIVNALLNVARAVECHVLAGIQPFGRTYYKPVVGTLAAVATLLLWRLVPGTGTVIELAGVVLAAAVAVVVLWALGMDPEERYVWDLIRGKLLRGRGRSS
jgi:O-antigen/teichoic acid export membrane protein